MTVRYEVCCSLVFTSLPAAQAAATGNIHTERHSRAQLQALIPLPTPVPRSPDDGEILELNGFAGPEFGGTIWGTHAGQGGHAFGGTTVFADANTPAFTVSVSSASLPIPAGKKFAGQITVDFESFDPGAFSVHAFDLLGIKDPDGENFINTVEVIGAGELQTDGYRIFWTGTGADLVDNSVVVIKWTQVPAPGNLFALSLGSLVLAQRGRRRR